MSDSLRDQLLKAGLVNKSQIQQAKRQKRVQPKKKKGQPTSLAESYAARRALEKAEKDRELNRQRQEKAARKARMAEIRQLTEQNCLPKVEGDDYYNFTDDKKVGRIAVTADLREKIIGGQLNIVRYRGSYVLVPASIGTRIREREASMVIDINAASSEASDIDDAYKDFVVPDDLTW